MIRRAYKLAHYHKCLINCKYKRQDSFKKFIQYDSEYPSIREAFLLNTPMNHFCVKKPDILNSPKTAELIFKRLSQKVKYAEELQQILQGNINPEKASSRQQMRLQLNSMVALRQVHEHMSAVLNNLTDLREMLRETTENEEKDIINKDILQLQEKKQELKLEALELMLPPDAYDDVEQITMEFRSGAGGAQSSIFVEDISQMYGGYCSSQGWRTQMVGGQKQSGVSLGWKYLNLKITGQGVHRALRCEAGVHKVIRVPETEAKGRLHSSTVSVVVMPVVPFNFSLDLKDVKYQFTRSSGPGGQGVNKTESACRAIHIPSGLAVFIQEQRSQEMNKKRATEILKERLFQIEYRKAVESESSARKSQVVTMDRSQKIRTYNYPQDRITDHRTGLTLFGIKSMMAGAYLDQFISSFNQTVHEEKISALISELYEQDKN